MTLVIGNQNMFEIVKLGIAMRNAQKAYSKNRTLDNSFMKKNAEKAFDKAAEIAMQNHEAAA
jgi:hypothetical protein